MSAQDLAITLGVEEEFFLVDPESRDLLADPDPGIFEFCEREAGPHKVVPELLRSQIETNTRVCESVAEVRAALAETRRLVIDAAARHGAAVMAASTHPISTWQTQMITAKERYQRFAVAFQDTVRRFVVGGMHVHAGFGSPDERVRVMTAMRRYLPFLHALSTSSPFHGGRETGFKSYRLNLICSLPRSSLPGPLWSRAEFDELVESYRSMEFIEDGTELWWDIRPSQRYPTVEMRICDICTRLDESMCMIALYASLVRRLLRREREGALPPEPFTEMIAENRWLAQRYGVLAFFGDTLAGGRTDIADYAVELVDELAEDARALECEAELNHALSIIRDGSSADRQVDLFRLRRLEGDTEAQALRAVVDAIIAETREGVAA